MSSSDSGSAPAATVRIERTVDASREFLFRCFTEAPLLKQWWAARSDARVEADIDARIGGKFRISYVTRDGTVRLTTGEFQELDAPAGLAFSWKWGDFTEDAEQTLVRVRFLSVEHGTRVVLRHGPFREHESLEAHEAGWRASLLYLSRCVERGSLLGGCR